MYKVLSVLGAFSALYILSHLTFIDELIASIGKIIVFVWASWQIGAIVHREIIVKRLPRVNTKDKSVFITGCDSGFGHLTALKLNEEGFTVFAGCLFPKGKGADSLKKMAKFQKKMIVVELDVSSDASVAAAQTTIRNHLNNNEQLWGIVNNAGIGPTNELEWVNVDEDYKKTYDINVFGVVRVIKAFLPLLRQSKGRIVNISSMGSRNGLPQLSAYCSSKSSVSTISVSLRQELRKFGVQVITMEPFFFATGINCFPIIQKSLIRGFEGLSSEVRADYGKKYLEALLNFYKVSSDGDVLMSKDLTKVSSAIHTALTVAKPEKRYSVGPWAMAPILWATTTLFPFDLQDALPRFNELITPLATMFYGVKYETAKED